MIHGMDVVDALGVMIEDLGGDPQRIAFLDFTVVGDVGLEHEGHTDLVPRVLEAAAELLAQRIGRLIEGHDVVTDVHVAVPVDPVGLNGGAVAIEGGAGVEFDHGVGS